MSVLMSHMKVCLSNTSPYPTHTFRRFSNLLGEKNELFTSKNDFSSRKGRGEILQKMQGIPKLSTTSCTALPQIVLRMLWLHQHQQTVTELLYNKRVYSEIKKIQKGKATHECPQKNLSPFGLAVWPAIRNMYTNVLFYWKDNNNKFLKGNPTWNPQTAHRVQYINKQLAAWNPKYNDENKLFMKNITSTNNKIITHHVMAIMKVVSLLKGMFTNFRILKYPNF